MLLDDFYKNKFVVVTGGCGFVGSYLVERLHEFGAEVVVLDDMSRGKWVFPSKATYYRTDVGNPDAVGSKIRGAYVVFNLAAAVAGVIYNNEHHLEMYERNMRLQTAPLLAAAQYDVPHFLQVSSVCVYSPKYNAPSLEENGHAESPHTANDGYAWSKRMGERAALWAGLRHTVVVRPSNIYGVRDYFDAKAHVIPALIKKVDEAGEHIILHGSGAEVREFIFATDVVEGMLHAMAFGEHNNVYNIGTSGDGRVTIRQLAGMIASRMGRDDLEIRTTPEANSGDQERWSDASKLMSLGWKPRIPLQDGLDGVVRHYWDCVKPKVRR